MGLLAKSHCLVWGSLAALIFCGAANPDRTISSNALALGQPEVPVTPLEPALAEGDASADEKTGADKSTVEGAGPTLASIDAGVRIVEPRAEVESPALPDKIDPQAASQACLKSDECVDQYLWFIYDRTKKLGSAKVVDKVKVTVTENGESRTVTKEVSKIVEEDFGWKDPDAAKKRGMSVQEYVIGGMDRAFKRRLYVLLHAMEDAGLAPGMTSGFRDDYRQSIASGQKAANDRSYHGGSLRGGYGHGLAADLVSVKGATQAERLITSEILWKWIDTHGQQFGIGRPYLDRDPPHVAPIDGKEYADKRGLNVKRAGLWERVQGD